MSETAHTPTANDRCCKRIFGSGYGFRGSPCSGKPKVFDGKNWFCSIHSPERVAARKKKSQEKYDAQYAASMARHHLHAAAQDMLAELKHLYEKHGYQSTADVIAKAEGRS